MRQIGRYQIEREIGRGGMGIVYRGKDPVLGRTVAIKSIRPSDLAEPEERAELERRLVREARSAGALGHPNIVTVHDLVQQDELTCIVMEFVEGQTLSQMLAAGQALDNATVLSVLRQASGALDYAHGKGIVHRDVKPANLIVQPGGTVKVADFGVARVTTTQHLTKSGTVMGTPYYMSPEQVQGKRVDGRADQFSLAVTAYEILTGRKPFMADTLTTLLYKIVHEDPVAPETLNTTLGSQVGSVLRKALSKEPEARYAACGEFVEALERACQAVKGWRALAPGEQPKERVPEPLETSRRAALRRWAPLGGATVLVLALAAATYFGLSRPTGTTEPAPIQPTPAESVPAPPTQPARIPQEPARQEAAAPPAEPVKPPKTTTPPAEKPAARTEKERVSKLEMASPPKETPVAKPAAATPPTTTATVEPRVEPAPAVAYSGPPSGSFLWTGVLQANGQLEIDGKKSSAGSVTNELPGVPVRIWLVPSTARLIEGPGPQNGWKRLIIGSGDRNFSRIHIRWEVVR